MKKKFYMIALTLVVCIFMSACGKSKAAKQTEELISTIGEVSLESEEVIKTAEESYNALSDKEKEQVDNYSTLAEARKNVDVLIAEEQKKAEEEAKKAEEEARKKEAEERKAQLAKIFCGTWINIYKEFPNSINMTSFESITIGEQMFTVETEFKPSGSRVHFTDEKHIDLHNMQGELIQCGGHEELKLYHNERSEYFVREEEYEAIKQERFLFVNLEEEDINGYLGNPIAIGDELDTWGDKIGTSYIVQNAKYEEGLVYIGCSNDTLLDGTIKGNHFNMNFTFSNPYFRFYTSGDANAFSVSINRSRGILIYAKAEYIEKNYLDANNLRKIKFTDGYSYNASDTINWGTTTANYDNYKI